MPYIKSEDRQELDPTIDKLVDLINSPEPGTNFAGKVNYVVTRLLLKTLPEKRYWSLALGVGTLVCCIFEFYRRYVGPYEDQAINTNGDIEEYK